MKLELRKAPSRTAAKRARTALRALSRVGESPIMVTNGALEVSVPPEAFKLFLEGLSHMANGNAVAVVPADAELTTQQAAVILGVSRPFLVNLIEEGKLEARHVGKHRRILVASLRRYIEVSEGAERSRGRGGAGKTRRAAADRRTT